MASPHKDAAKPVRVNPQSQWLRSSDGITTFVLSRRNGFGVGAVSPRVGVETLVEETERCNGFGGVVSPWTHGDATPIEKSVRSCYSRRVGRRPSAVIRSSRASAGSSSFSRGVPISSRK